MLLKRRILDGIADGSITLLFRRWRRPTVKAGGSLKTAIGVLAIGAVDQIRSIAAKDAIRAGYPTVDALNADLAAEFAGDRSGKKVDVIVGGKAADSIRRRAMRGE